MAAEIDVTVVYAEPARQTLIQVRVPVGATVAEVIERSAIHTVHGGIPDNVEFGIFGRRVTSAEVLDRGDRVELYRPLPADPKETRRRLAREGRTIARTRTRA